MLIVTVIEVKKATGNPRRSPAALFLQCRSSFPFTFDNLIIEKTRQTVRLLRSCNEQ